MGYSTNGGPKGLGNITDAASTAADMNKLIALIGEVGNHRVGSTSERDALTGAKLYEGLLWGNTTTGAIERRTGSGWKVVVYPDSGEVEVGRAAGWTASVTPTLRTRSGYASVNGRISGESSAGASPFGAALPAAARPLTERITFGLDGANTLHTIVIQPGGGFVVLTKSGALNDLRLGTIPPWPTGV